MRYHVLACDYDGTIAHHGAVDPATVKALAEVKQSGRRLVLVTGRQLEDLAQVFAPLDLFDRIVAENGGVLYDPATRQEKPLCEPPDETLLRILDERGVAPLSAGKVIVATWSPHEHVVLEAIHELGLELQVIFNKGAVMVLPTGINKASGLNAALEDMKLSPHNCVGIGDAENDHAFLKLCNCAVAVENALPAVKNSADLVTRGDHGRGVSELCDLLIREDLSSLAAQLKRHRIPLGTDDSDTEVVLAAHCGAVLVAGTSGGGKSTFTTAVLEQLIDAGYQVCIVDPEGDYQHFEQAAVLGTSDNFPAVEEVLEVLHEPRQSVVVNLLALGVAERPAFAGELLPELLKLRSATGRPHWIVIDEAHHLLPREWQAADTFVPDELTGYLLITVHPEQIATTVLETVETMIAIGSDPYETIGNFSGSLGRPMPPAVADGELASWRSDPLARRTRQPAGPLYQPASEPGFAPPPAQVRGRQAGRRPEFLFPRPDERLCLRAYNLASFMEIGDGLDDETWMHHLRRHDYSKWMRTRSRIAISRTNSSRSKSTANVTADESRARIRKAIENRYTLPA